MTATERLHYDDPFLLDFDARVVAHATHEGAPSVVLDRTAFYPEAGGQMADHGTLGVARVADVQVDDAGIVHHRIEAGDPLPAVGDAVRGTVERARRRAHMALHTGQHMLSRALLETAGGATVSSRLGETTCTIDLDKEVVDERAVAAAESLVNGLIDDDAPVRAWFPSPEELATLALRRPPKVAGPVRIVRVGDFNVCPCGGTHCTRTAQVGLVRVEGIERYKGKARVVFSAGPRARGVLWEHAAVLRDLGRELTCGPRDVPAAVDKLTRELGATREDLGRARGRLAEALAGELRRQAGADAGAEGGAVVAVLEGAGLDLVRAVAGRLTAEPGAVALLAGRTEDALAVIAARGSASRFDCGKLLKQVAAAAGGRGGGRPEHAEGRLPAEADWVALVRRVLEAPG